MHREVLGTWDCVVVQSLLVRAPQLRPLFKAFTSVDKAIFIDDRHVVSGWRFSDFDTAKECLGGFFLLEIFGQDIQVEVTLEAGAKSCKVVVNGLWFSRLVK